MTRCQAILSAFLILAFNFIFIRYAHAIDAPSFPTCAAAVGTLKVYYANGTHGIPGDTTTHTGSDTVISYTNNQLIQCFCDERGSGIKTNWWKTGSLTDGERAQLLADGWNYIPDGSAWGLENTTYFAKNSPMSCAYGGRGGGMVLGTGGGDVLGLAATGNITQILGFFVFGVLLLYCATKLNK